MSTIKDRLIRHLGDAIDDALSDRSVVTPEFLAETWCEMDAKQQATFFNTVARLARHWQNHPGEQWSAIERQLSPDGRRLIREIAEYVE